MLLSSTKNFCYAINKLSCIFTQLDRREINSPYTLIPIIAQIFGLSTPLMGSGRSPYSLINYPNLLINQHALMNDIFNMPLAERRLIVDEIYGMIAPILLGEIDDYIDLIAETKYSAYPKTVIVHDYHMKSKIATQLILSFLTQNNDFAHIAHYGQIDDIYMEQNFLKDFSEIHVDRWYKKSYPIVNELSIQGFPNTDLNNKTSINGCVIFVPNSTMQLLRDGEMRREKILKCARLAKILGAKIVGMGGLIASFAGGGEYLSQAIPGLGFTTGHAYTIANVLSVYKKCCEKLITNANGAIAVIVGAAGSIGSGCAKLLVNEQISELILIDTNSLIAYRKLTALKEELLNEHNKITITISNKLADMRTADLIIVATNSPLAIIQSDYIKPGAIVIDDSFPKNVSRDVIQIRKDVIFLEGGAARFPSGININVARNMPDLIDAPLTRLMSCKEVYSSFAETLILSLLNHQGNYGLGSASTKLAYEIQANAKKVGIYPTLLQCYNEGVEDNRFLEASKAINGQRILD